MNPLCIIQPAPKCWPIITILTWTAPYINIINTIYSHWWSVYTVADGLHIQSQIIFIYSHWWSYIQSLMVLYRVADGLIYSLWETETTCVTILFQRWQTRYHSDWSANYILSGVTFPVSCPIIPAETKEDFKKNEYGPRRRTLGGRGPKVWPPL